MGGKVGWRSPEGWWMFLEKHVVVWAMPPCLKMPLRMYGSAADAMTAQWVSCIDYTTFCEYISSLFHRDTELLGLLHPLYRYVEMQRLHAWKTGIKSTLKTFPGAWSGPLGKGHWQHGTHYPGTEFVFVNDCLGVVPKVVNEALLPGNFGSLTGRKKLWASFTFWINCEVRWTCLERNRIWTRFFSMASFFSVKIVRLWSVGLIAPLQLPIWMHEKILLLWEWRSDSSIDI